MKRLLFATLCLLGSLELYSQSPKSVREEYPDDMYTTIDGKEVRVNTLPQRLIDSLEALPPKKRIFAIYKVEQVDRAEELNKPSEVHKIPEFDYWVDKSVERTYYVYRNIDGTTRIEDDNGNWMLFKTEYQRNEYTGEISSTPIKGETYCGRGGKKDVPLISAYRILPNGYKLEVNGEEKEITMTYLPLGISYTTKKDRILSRIWYEWISEANFDGSFNEIFYEKDKMIIKGRNGEILENCKNISFSDIAGNKISGGYYDKKNHCMYYGLGDRKNIISPYGYMMKLYPDDNSIDNTLDPFLLQMKQERERIEKINIQHKDDKNKLPEIQDEISRLKKQLDLLTKKHKKELAEYVKKNGTFTQKSRDGQSELLKQQRLKEGEIEKRIRSLEYQAKNISFEKGNYKPQYKLYEALNITLIPCIPSDKIKEFKANNNVSEVYYENGDYFKMSKLKNGEVFEGKVRRPQGVWTIKLDENNKVNSQFVFTKGRYKGLSYSDVLTTATIDMERLIISRGAKLYSPSEKRWLTVLQGTGDIEEYLKEKQAQQDAIEKAKMDKQEQSIYAAYCKKYGKSNIDNIMNFEVHTGMPFSVVKTFCLTELTDEMTGGNWYRVLCLGLKYDYQNNQLVTPDMRSVPTAVASYFLVRVSNGVVQSVHRMKIY